ncbi:MAG: hypothetical protein H6672_06525 [Anaerolineaceae bacterium]|nr:hypothetical protein [Anaerolineaceae bacterium]
MSKRMLFILGMMALLLVGFSSVTAQDNEPISIIFMHHSTGLGVIQGGHLRGAFTDLGYAFWDHGYNDEGLVDPAGEYLGINWDVPGDNTDPDGWYEIFQQPFTDPPTNTFSHMLQQDVIIFKSCFPTSDIIDEEMFAAYQRYYLTIRDVMDQYPDKLFIAWSTPPLVPNSTTLENAARARRWSAYLTSAEYLEGHPNVFVFDFFSLLADEDGFLRTEYRPDDEWDSHPNDLANGMVGPILVAFVDEAARNFVPGEPSVQPQLVQPETVTTAPLAAVMPGDMLADFELDASQLVDRWWTYGDADVAIGALELVTPGVDSEHALHITFSSPPQQYGNFGMGFEPLQDWSSASGISFHWKTNQPDMLVNVYIAIADPEHHDDSTPFAAEMTPPVGDWEPVTLLWEDFVKPDWMGDEGLDVFDPAYVRDISFGFGDWEKSLEAELWIDEIRLVSAE